MRTPRNEFKIIYKWCPNQVDGVSCGIHAIANATEIILNKRSYLDMNWDWDQGAMRSHLKQCLETGLFKSFPKVLKRTADQVIVDPIFVVEVFCICRQPALPDSLYLPKRMYINWIQCRNDKCMKWYHNQCVGILDKDLPFWKKNKYICPTCAVRMFFTSLPYLIDYVARYTLRFLAKPLYTYFPSVK